MSSLGDSPASKPAWQQLSLVDVSGSPGQTAAYGDTCTASSVMFGRDSPSWKIPSRPRLMRCREIWRALAAEYPDTRLRLQVLVARIYGGECSLLPTLTARDWRSPGRTDHPRLQASRGLPLNETLGCNLSAEFCEWIMGIPIGWTDVSGFTRAEMPLFRKPRSGSPNASKKRTRSKPSA